MQTSNYSLARFENICRGCKHRDGDWCMVRKNLAPGYPAEESFVIPSDCPRYNVHRDLRASYFVNEVGEESDVLVICKNNRGVESFFDIWVEYLALNVDWRENFIRVQDKYGQIREMDPSRFEIHVPGFGTINLAEEQ